MVGNLLRYWTTSQIPLLAVGGIIFVLELWLIFEAALALRNALDARARRAADGGQSDAA